MMFVAMFVVSVFFALWSRAGLVNIRILNDTYEQIEIVILQAGNHSTRSQVRGIIESGSRHEFRVRTRVLDRSFVTITSESGRVGRFRRPNGDGSFYRLETYCIDDTFLQPSDLNGAIVYQDPPVLVEK